jgi:hypothetical protein
MKFGSEVRLNQRKRVTGLKQKIQDRIILIALTGTISAAIANTFGYLTKLIDPNTAIMPEVAAELFLHKPYLHTFLGIIFGNIWSFVVGGLHAVAFVYTLEFTGWRYLWIKSLTVTSVGWLLGVGLLFRALNIADQVHKDPLGMVFFYLAHIVYASVSAFIVGRYGAKASAW